MRKIQCIILSVLFFIEAGVLGAMPVAALTDSQKDIVTASEFSFDTGDYSYSEYRSANNSPNYPTEKIDVDIASAVGADGDTPIFESGYADSEKAVKMQEKKGISFPVVTKDGWYKIKIKYEAIAGKGTDIQFSLAIDGKVPFSEASGILINRLWEEQMPEGYDKSDDSVKPSQEQVFEAQTASLFADSAITDEDTWFYFSEGEHTITLQSSRGEFWLGAMELYNSESVPSYEEYIKGYEEKNIVPAAVDAETVYIQGEDAVYKSHPSVKSIADYSSSDTMPYNVFKDLLNTFGGEIWAQSGQWGEWNFEIETAGFYQFAFRYKQNFKSGTYVIRSMTIDGEHPFKEAASIEFSYDLGWQVMGLGDEDSMYIYLEPGKHVMRLEVAYGALSPILTEVQSCLDEMNVIYRDIMMITGASPDSLRDYNIGEVLPDCANDCGKLSERLYDVLDLLVKETGGKGSETSAIEKIAIQLEEFSEDVETIPKRLSTYNSNISTLASWLITAKNQPLLLDYVMVSPVGTSLPRNEAPWYMQIWNEIQRFFVSFVEDYDDISTSKETDEEPITIWLNMGRDQATVIQTLVRDGFSAETGIPVNLRLITADIMPAVASGAGPDLAMFQDQSLTINYALRNAVYDLNQWPDIEEVKSRFYDESLRCFALGDSLYALPESVSCDVMYYRKDIFKQLGLDVPETWDELYKVITVLEKNNLQFGVNSSFTATSNTVSSTFIAMLYQLGGTVYDSDYKYSVLDNKYGVEAFNKYCELYTKHGVPQKIDLLTRFRTGEAPLVINSFAFGSQMAVSAPEISGLWGTALIPGTVKADGTVDHSALISGSGVIMLNNARNKENSWEYMKWWTRADTQEQYAISIEAALGISGRWNSANKEAFSNSAWSTEELDIITEQLEYSKAFPEVAGGYYTARSINNAIRSVVNQYSEPKETLYEYVTDINKEIKQKRREFGMEE